MVVGQGDEAPLRAATLEAAKGDARISYMHLNRRGASTARNAGLHATSGEIAVFMDDDCEADVDWLANLDACFEPAIGFVGGEVTAPPTSRRFFAVCPEVHPAEIIFDPTQTPDAPEGFGLLGANMAVRRTVATRVGIFDECLGPGTRFAGAEEHDYCARLAILGISMRSTSTASVEHTYGYRFGFRDYYRHRKERLGADGALAAKRKLVSDAPSLPNVRTSVLGELRMQLRTIKPLRLPNNVFRLYHYMQSYRECISGYELLAGYGDDMANAVLTRRSPPAGSS
jgi:glycosyltransferase involved in cell wall biosynthesis